MDARNLLCWANLNWDCGSYIVKDEEINLRFSWNKFMHFTAQCDDLRWTLETYEYLGSIIANWSQHQTVDYFVIHFVVLIEVIIAIQSDVLCIDLVLHIYSFDFDWLWLR